jgi:hypothetical protein
MADEAPVLGPDEWDPPSLGEPMRFAAPLPLRLRDVLLLLVLLGYGWIWWRTYRDAIPTPIIAAYLLAVTLVVLNMIPIKGLPLPRFVGLAFAHWRLMRAAPSTWGQTDVPSGPSTEGRSRWTAFLPPEIGKAIHANVAIGSRGIVDVGGPLVRLPQGMRSAAIQALGKERFRALIELSTMGDVSLLSPQAKRGLWTLRLNLFGDLRWPLSLHMMTRPFPPHELEIASGPVWREAGLLARRLVRRRLILALHGGTVDVVRSRLTELCGTDRAGKLRSAGLGYKVLGSTEIEALADDAFGKRRAPALSVAPYSFEVRTGTDDPDPIMADTRLARVRGTRTWVTFAAKRLPKHKLSVGWLRTLTNGRVEGDVVLHLTPVDRWQSQLWTKLKASWWQQVPWGKQDFAGMARQALRHMALLDERATTTIRVGLYASTPETHAEDMALALDDMLGRDNYTRPILRQQQGRQSTEPFGRDTLNMRFETDSQTVAMAGPPSGGVMVPGGIFFATAAETPEPICWNPWYRSDKAPVACIFGATGSGKTNAEMVILASILEPHPEHELAQQRVPVVVLYFKPLDEWAAFCARFDGVHLHPEQHDWEQVLEAAPIGEVPIVAINLNDLDETTQTTFTRRFSERVMHYQRTQGENFRRRFVYVVGEAWVLARTREGAAQLQGMALRVRSLRICLILDTQYIDHLLNSAAADVLRSSSMWLLMQLDEGERDLVKKRLALSDAAFDFLVMLEQPNTLDGETAVRGSFLGMVHGLRVKGYVERLGELARLGNQTDPAAREDNPNTFRRRPLANGHGTREDVTGAQLVAGGR